MSKKYNYGPYADAPQMIGHKVTISAPYIHAVPLEVLANHLVQRDCVALDVGCGSGVLVGYMVSEIELLYPLHVCGLSRESARTRPR